MIATPSIATRLLWVLGAAGFGVLGCASTYDPASGDLESDLVHRDPRVRIEAARQSVVDGRTDLAPLLVKNLSDRDAAVRFYTAAALRKLTGLDHGYRPYSTVTEREAAIARWSEWLAKAPGGAPMAEPGPAPGPQP